MTMILDGSNGVTFNDASLQGAAASPYVLKNRIINGDMVIDQRNAGASVTPATAQYTLDRWVCYVSQSSKFSVQQNAGAVTPPAGFTNYLGVTSLSAYSVLSGDFFLVQQRLEGFNVADLGWGTANAQTITVSFWARSSLTGTFGGVIKNAAATYSYPFTYSLPTANTWTKISITIPGQTAGAWPTTNSFCFEVSFGMGVGSTESGPANAWSAVAYGGATGATSVVGTNAATWYVTGVQLEIGTSATPFERRLYNQELANCQRYYQVAKSSVNVAASSTAMNGIIPLFVTLRSDVVTVGKTSGNIAMGDMVSAGFSSSSTPTDSGYQNNALSFSYNQAGFTGLTTYRTYRNEPNAINPGLFTLSAEL
jgi:hypothetical protein